VRPVSARRLQPFGEISRVLHEENGQLRLAQPEVNGSRISQIRFRPSFLYLRAPARVRKQFARQTETVATPVGLVLYAHRNRGPEPARVGAGAFGRMAGRLRGMFKEFF